MQVVLSLPGQSFFSFFLVQPCRAMNRAARRAHCAPPRQSITHQGVVGVEVLHCGEVAPAHGRALQHKRKKAPPRLSLTKACCMKSTASQVRKGGYSTCLVRMSPSVCWAEACAHRTPAGLRVGAHGPWARARGVQGRAGPSRAGGGTWATRQGLPGGEGQLEGRRFKGRRCRRAHRLSKGLEPPQQVARARVPRDPLMQRAGATAAGGKGAKGPTEAKGAPPVSSSYASTPADQQSTLFVYLQWCEGGRAGQHVSN